MTGKPRFYIALFHAVDMSRLDSLQRLRLIRLTKAIVEERGESPYDAEYTWYPPGHPIGCECNSDDGTERLLRII